MAVLSGKLTKNLVRTLGTVATATGAACTFSSIHPARGVGLYASRVKGQRNREGNPLRTDFGFGGADIATLNQAREARELKLNKARV